MEERFGHRNRFRIEGGADHTGQSTLSVEGFGQTDGGAGRASRVLHEIHEGDDENLLIGHRFSVSPLDPPSSSWAGWDRISYGMLATRGRLPNGHASARMVRLFLGARHGWASGSAIRVVSVARRSIQLLESFGGEFRIRIES